VATRARKAPPRELVTILDFIRYATTRFVEAKLMFGHGTPDPAEEAIFLVGEALHLAPDRIDSFLPGRLTAAERQKVFGLIETRIKTRKPSAYLLRRVYLQGVPFHVDERVIVPRSYIAELLAGDLFEDGGLLPDGPSAVTRVLDLCTGSGCLAILACRAFPNAMVDAVDLSPKALEVAKINVAEHDLEDRITLYKGDLFAPLGDARYDLILTNPPYVDADAMKNLPPEFRHEPKLALAGGPDGLDVVRRILADAPRHLTPDGALLCEIGRGREALEACEPTKKFLWLDTVESAGEVFWLSAKDLSSPSA
jgi:ribosomal protein L3 glutamine methyltransferase